MTTAAAAAATATAPDEIQSSMTLNDIRSFCQIIEVCSQRGSFKPEEMVDVGTLYTKTMAFLKEAGFFNVKKEAATETPLAPTETQ